MGATTTEKSTRSPSSATGNREGHDNKKVHDKPKLHNREVNSATEKSTTVSSVTQATAKHAARIEASTTSIVARVRASTSLHHLSAAVGASSTSKRTNASGRRRPQSTAKLTNAPATAKNAPRFHAAMSRTSTTELANTLPGSPSSNMTLRAKIVDSVIVLGGVGAAAAVAGGVAAAVIHNKADSKEHAKARPLFLASRSHFGSGAPKHALGRAFTSTSATLTPGPVLHDASANAIQMFPARRAARSVQTGNAQPLGLQIHSHRDSDFQLNFPQPAWILVVCLGLIGGGLLVAGILQLICCGRRQKSSRVWMRADDSECQTAEAGGQLQPTSCEESVDPEVPLLPPLPPLLPRPVQTMSFPPVASVPTVSFASVGSAPTMSFTVAPTRYAAVGATQLPQSFALLN